MGALVYPTWLIKAGDARLLTGADDPRLGSGADYHGNIFLAQFGTRATTAPVLETMYWVYVGRMPVAKTLAYVRVWTTVAGSGTDPEFGLFSTPNPPDGTAQTVTKLASTATVTWGTGMCRNTNSFAQAIAAGTPLWLGMNYQGNEDAITHSVLRDYGMGRILRRDTSGSDTFAGAATFTTSLFSGNDPCPDLFATTF